MAQAQTKKEVKEAIAKLTAGLQELADILLKENGSHSLVESSKKRRRDPNAPKQPPSNFLLFSEAIREEVERENPTSSFVEKAKIYGVKWQQLTEEEKKPYTEKAKEEREKYLKAVEAYQKSLNKGQDQPEPASKKAKQVKAPVKAPVKAEAKVIEAESSSTDEEDDSSESDSE